jgi:hypothetical protein
LNGETIRALAPAKGAPTVAKAKRTGTGASGTAQAVP